MTAEELIIKSLEKELRRERIKNLKLRMRMAILIQHPDGTASEKISKAFIAENDFSNSILHLN
jgi:hypothetical protein